MLSGYHRFPSVNPRATHSDRSCKRQCDTQAILSGHPMTVTDAPGALKKFRRTPWKFQQTYLTPLQHLQSFVAASVSVNQEMKSACLTIEQAVFEPTHLVKLLASYSMPPRYECGVSFTATGQEE